MQTYFAIKLLVILISLSEANCIRSHKTTTHLCIFYSGSTFYPARLLPHLHQISAVVLLGKNLVYVWCKFSILFQKTILVSNVSPKASKNSTHSMPSKMQLMHILVGENQGILIFHRL